MSETPRTNQESSPNVSRHHAQTEKGLLSLSSWLEKKRQTLRRFTPEEAFTAFQGGAWLIDTRPLEKKMASGLIPGAREIRLDILPWRVHPDAENRELNIQPEDLIIILCDQGYSSSVAAAELAELGFNVTDVEGGYQAWVAAGLPWQPYQ